MGVKGKGLNVKERGSLKRSLKRIGKGLGNESKGRATLDKAVTKIKRDIEVNEAIAEERSGRRQRRGVILLEHIPHGFYEEEMTKYFSQFGKVFRVHLARSIKTGKSKGYAFVEFEFEDVAKIAAETMHNYLMFDRLIKCRLLNTEEIKTAQLFPKNVVTEENYPKLVNRKLAKQKEATEIKDKQKSLNKRLMQLKKHNEKMAQHGIDYEYPIPQGLLPPEPIVKDKGKPETVDEIAYYFSYDKSEDSSDSEEDGSDSDNISDLENEKSEDSSDSPSSQELDDEEELENIILEKAQPSPKAAEKVQSPPQLKSKSPSLSPAQKPVQQIKRKSEPVKSTTPNLPRISPKNLRSRGRKSEAPTPISKPVDSPKGGKKAPAKARKVEDDSKALPLKKDMPKELPKISPKLLRSRMNSGKGKPASPTKVKKAETPKGKPTEAPEPINVKEKALPKFSPKFLRSKSRKSDIGTPSKQPSPKGNKAKGRKSIR